LNEKTDKLNKLVLSISIPITDLTDENSFHRAKYWINELHTYEEVTQKLNLLL